MKAFALSFGMGVVSGIVLSYQFGTNWSVFADKTGPVLGPLMGYEVLTAFFLEAGFLGIMLFGVNRVPKRDAFHRDVIVAIGALLSAFWILAANSWMQTPAGYAMNAAGQFVPVDWLAVIFNPSFPYRLVHMVLAAYLATAFVVGATGAYHLLRGRHGPMVRTMFSMAMWMAAIVAPLQLIVGDQHGLNTLKHQPAKVAAMEGHFEAEQKGAPLILFGLPDMAGGRDALRDLDTEARQPGPDARSERHREGPEKLAARGLAARADRLLEFSRHGRARPADDRDRARQPVAQMARKTLRNAALRALVPAHGPVRLRRASRRLVRHRDRAPALHGLWLAPDRRFRLADRSPGVALSLIAFVVVYLIVFGIGVWYLLRLMRADPEAQSATEPEAPLRAAGITPVQATHRPVGEG